MQRSSIRYRLLVAVAWLCFVMLVAVGGYLTLAACDLGLHPIFSLAYCKALAAPDRLEGERNRERDLRDRIHQAELRAARLPACAPSAIEEPKRLAEADPPPKLPEPEKKQDSPEPQQELTIPQNLSDLKGCWQSKSGDIAMYSDDEERRQMGTVRICYCFDNKGGGTARYLWTNGSRCVGPLKAKLAFDRLSFRHELIRCAPRKQGRVVGREVVCRTDSTGGAATCDQQIFSRFPITKPIENYHRVSDEYCK